MRQSVSLALGLVVMAGCILPSGDQTAPPKESARNRQTLDWIQGLLIDSDLAVQQQAIRGLADAGTTNQQALQILSRFLFSCRCSGAIMHDVAQGLARAGESSVSQVVDAYQEATDFPDRLERVLLVIGHVGPQARTAVPFLKERLAEAEGNLEVSGAIRALLANFSEGTQGDVDELCSDLANLTPRGRGTAGMLLAVGGGSWVTADVVRSIGKRLAKPEDESSIEAAKILAALGEIAKPARQDLLSLAVAVRKHGELSPGYRIIYRVLLDLAIAQIDAKERSGALQDLARFSGPNGNIGRLGRVELQEGTRVMSRALKDGILKLLDDQDPEVVLGAIEMLITIGCPIREAAPQLLEIARKNIDARVRERAFAALADVADPGVIPALETLAAKQESESIHTQIGKTIRLLRVREKVRACFCQGVE